MADNLRGRNAVITGGATRIGKAITHALAEAGCNVFVHYGESTLTSCRDDDLCLLRFSLRHLGSK